MKTESTLYAIESKCYESHVLMVVKDGAVHLHVFIGTRTFPESNADIDICFFQHLQNL